MSEHKRVPKPGQSLAEQYPAIASEWDYEKNSKITPDQIFPHSSLVVWWKCKNCNNSWKKEVYNRTYGSNCPYCTRRLPMVGINDLATMHPDISSEWYFEANFPLLPEQVLPQSNRKVWWKCKVCNNCWQAIICSRTRDNHGCPYCAGKRPIVGKNDFKTLYPSISFEWSLEHNGTLKPEQVLPYSNKKIWWKCSNCNNLWQASVCNRTMHGSSCPYCSGRRPIIGENDLFTLHREIALEWNYELNKDLIPEYVSENSGRKVWWKCKTCGNSWEAVIRSRTRGTGCPYCVGKRPIIRKSDMSTLYPNIAAEADHEINGTQTPEQFTAYSSKILGWKCAKCNHKWKMAIKRRTRGAKCPKCRRINYN